MCHVPSSCVPLFLFQLKIATRPRRLLPAATLDSVLSCARFLRLRFSLSWRHGKSVLLSSSRPSSNGKQRKCATTMCHAKEDQKTMTNRACPGAKANASCSHQLLPRAMASDVNVQRRRMHDVPCEGGLKKRLTISIVNCCISNKSRPPRGHFFQLILQLADTVL
jgi:hypothetical protein